MSAAEVVDHLRALTNDERLVVIEAATKLIRDDLPPPGDVSRQERNRRLREAAAAARDLYQTGGELTEWTTLDAEEFVDDYRQS